MAQPPPTMKALRITRDNPNVPPTLTVSSIPTPKPQPGQLLLKIHATPVLPSDILNAHGAFPTTTLPRTPGRDFAGTVVAGPPEWCGKQVYGTSGATFSFTVDGAGTEYAVLPPDGVAEKPVRLSWPQAAGVGTVFTTALMGMRRGRVREGEMVMVLGGTGAVGSAAVQIAKAMGCRTISVGRHGADINSVDDPELKRAVELSDWRGPDVVFDTVGDLALTRAAFSVLAQKGRLVTITAPRQGSTEVGVDVLSLYRREMEVIGCNSASQSQSDMAKLLDELRPKFESGELKAPDDSTMTLIGIDQAPDAYSGKIKKAVIVFDD